MALTVERVDVWAAGIDDRPGALATKLSALARAGADLEFIVARRAPEKPGTGVVFVTPLVGDREVAAAADVGFTPAHSLHSVRVQGPNKPGIAAKLADKVAQAGINLRGLSAGVIGKQFLLHMAFATAEQADKAVKLLKGRAPKKKA